MAKSEYHPVIRNDLEELTNNTIAALAGIADELNTINTNLTATINANGTAISTNTTAITALDARITALEGS